MKNEETEISLERCCLALGVCCYVRRELWKKISERDSVDLGRTTASAPMGTTLVWVQ